MTGHVDGQTDRRQPPTVPRVERAELMTELERLGLWSDRVRAGLELADQAHAEQRRYGGGSYLEEHIYVVTQETARYLAAHPEQAPQPLLREDAVLTALLHDTIEDSDWVNRDVVRERFGPTVAHWVTALTKPSKVSDAPPNEPNYLAGIRHIGPPVTAIKVLDRINNLAGLHLRPRQDRQAYLDESRDYYLPLAERVDPALVDQLAYLIEQQESLLLDHDTVD